MIKVSRRGMLKALGWGAAGITVVATTGSYMFPVLPSRKEPTAKDAAAWISLRPDGRIKIAAPRVEMGQGIAIGFRQIVAEELFIDLAGTTLIQPDTAIIPLCRATVGSESMKDFGPLVAQAGATLAVELRTRAAMEMGTQSEKVVLEHGRALGPGGKELTFANLAAGRPVLLESKGAQDVRSRSFSAEHKRRIVGQPVPTHDIRAIVTGEGVLYADDIHLPDMVFGAVIRSDGVDGAVTDIDDEACKSIPGYIGLFRDGSFHGVLAERRGALEEVKRSLWVEDKFDTNIANDTLHRAIDIDDKRAGSSLEHTLIDRGELQQGGWDIDIRLDVPFASHASIEPRVAVARFDNDSKLEIWTGTQDAFFVRDTLAETLGLAKDKVIVHGMRIGGGFGARSLVGAELEAARLARLSGRPVKVVWSRQDEFRAGFHRPPSSHRVRASADRNGKLTRWHHAFRSGHIIFTSAGMGPLLQMVTSVVADPGSARGAIPPYEIEACRVEFEDVRLPVMTGPWRGLGALSNVWAVETAMDAIARTHGWDPFDFRLANLTPKQARLATVLKKVADMADWTGRRTDSNYTMGIACGIYKDMSYSAIAAEVDITQDPVRVRQVWCAHDCGRIVNPDQVRAQIEGNIVWGIGSALKEELRIKDGRIVPSNFSAYPMMRYSEVPEIDIALLEGENIPTGAGETAIVCSAAAVTNAISAGTEVAVKRLPHQSG